MPKACTTRIPERRLLDQLGDLARGWTGDWTVTFFSRLAMRITGRRVMGMAPKATSESFQSRRKQFASITTHREPVAQVAGDGVGDRRLHRLHVVADTREIRSPEWRRV